MRPVVLLLAVGCGDKAANNAEWPVASFLLVDGVHLEHTPIDNADQPATLLEAHDSSWEIRSGAESWDDATPVDTFSADVASGLALDGEPILPETLTVGKDGVTALGEHQTWYGMFPRTVTVEIDGGRWAGTQVFAEHLGPVTYTLDGEVWDLVYYDEPGR